MKGFALYATACVIAVALIGAVAWSFVDPAGRQAMLVSGALAVVVQLVAFTVARQMRRNIMVGWGLGSVLRLLVLVAYAIVLARVGRATLTPALVSFVGFLFVTTVIEPIFLKQ